jgi:hypothetical protein
MTIGGRRLQAFAIGAAMLAAATACDVSDPAAPSKARLDGLVRQHATRVEVAAALGAGYTWYAPGTTEWQGLHDFLGREDTRVYAPVVKAVEAERRIMFYTTAWQQTWLFLDEAERLQSYWTNSQ